MKGFTIIEIAVVLTITVILSTILVAYNRSSNNQIVLSINQAKVMSFLNRAKSFALEKKLVKGGENACAFGVYFEAPRTMILFKDVPNPNNTNGCSSNNNFQYDENNGEKLEELYLDGQVEFSSNNNLPLNVAFEPPYLKTHVSNNVNNATITIQVVNEPNISSTIYIGPEGEISVQ